MKANFRRSAAIVFLHRLASQDSGKRLLLSKRPLRTKSFYLSLGYKKTVELVLRQFTRQTIGLGAAGDSSCRDRVILGNFLHAIVVTRVAHDRVIPEGENVCSPVEFQR